jgi:hypothetical protein
VSAPLLQYASPQVVPERRRQPVRALLTAVSLLGIEVVLALLNPGGLIWPVAYLLGIAILITSLASIGLAIRCIVPSAGPKLPVAERRTLVGECASCGYDLRGIDAERCPECGWLVPWPQSVLRWPDPAGPREDASVDHSGEVEAYLRAVMRGRPPFFPPQWDDDPDRGDLARDLAEAFRDANRLDSLHFLPEDSFAVAAVSSWAHYGALRVLDPYLGDAFRKDVAKRLGGMTLGEVVDWAVRSAEARGALVRAG